MLKCLGVLAILAIVTGGCSANRPSAGRPSANAATASAAQTDTPAVKFDPCRHGVYEQLRQLLLARPVGIDDRDRNYLFELDRQCREHSNALDAGPAEERPPRQVRDEEAPACTHPLYRSLRDRVQRNPGPLTDEDHWYFHELDRACVQGKVAVAEQHLVAAANKQVKDNSNRNPYYWAAFLAGLVVLGLNLFGSAR